MSHESTHNLAHENADSKRRTSFSSAFWFVLILSGLFISVVNFVAVVSEGDGDHDAHASHAPAPSHDAHGDAHH